MSFQIKRDEYESSILSLTSIIAILIAIIYILAPSFWQHTLGLTNAVIVLMLIGFLFAPARDFGLQDKGMNINIS